MKNKTILFVLILAANIFLTTNYSQAAITISGDDTIATGGNKTYTASGCSGTVTWGVTNPGASIQSGVLTTSGACGTVLVAARCSADGAIATKTVRVSNVGQWTLETTSINCSDAYTSSVYVIVGHQKYIDFLFFDITCPRPLPDHGSCGVMCLCPPSAGQCYNPPWVGGGFVGIDVYRTKREVYSWQCPSSSCPYNITPSAEICGDLIDNNCNGQVDEGCECIDGQTQSCPYSGPTGTENVGECKAATKTCSGGHWGTCVGEVLPTAEICDGIDNDCNGVIDDLPPQSCYTGPSGTENKGICHAGNQTCTNGQWGTCQGEVTPQTELCGDTLDSNCDGDPDKNCKKPEGDSGNPDPCKDENASH